MRISAVVGVKDEVALIVASVAALRRAGVTSVWVMDDASTDGTAEAIAAMARDGIVRLVPPQDDQMRLLDMDGPLFGPILAQDRPDWLMFCDADEIVLPRDGRISGTAGLEAADVIRIPRYNVAPLPEWASAPPDWLDDATLRDLPLITRRSTLDWPAMAADADLRWITTDLPDKLLVRPEAIAGYSVGAHNVRPLSRGGPPVRTLRKTRATDLLIAHLPFTSYPRFARKVANIAAAAEGMEIPPLSTRKGWHWWRWIYQHRRGLLAAEFAHQALDARTRAAWQAQGALATVARLLD
jgi:glycosyltransferase involved in cell wall biosynthesis